MDSNSNNYSQFIEHSFRRLTLLIHQQDDIDDSKQSSLSSPLINKTNNHDQSMNNNELTETKIKVEPMLRTCRTYMRPPKNRTTTISHRCSSSSQLSDDRPETFLNHSLNSSYSPSIKSPKSNELPIHMPYERTLYDIKFERDRQNDVREKYNIPPPFQRKWLRQPRYVPQERPNIGKMQQSQNS